MIWAAAASFAVAFGILVASFIIFIKKHRKLTKDSSSVTPLSFFIGGIFISAVILLLPLYIDKYKNLAASVFLCIPSSIHHAMQLFTMDADREIIEQCYEVFGGFLGHCYAALLSFEFILAPLAVAGFIATFFKNHLSYFKFVRGNSDEAHVFSELNEKSITLAKSIVERNQKAMIIFTDVFEQNEEVSFELMKKAKQIPAICFKKDILAFDYSRKKTLKKLYYYVIGEDETENINHALELAHTYKQKQPNSVEECYLYVFTMRDECEYLINQRTEDIQKKGDKSQQNDSRLKIRRIHEISSLIYHKLYQDGYEKLYASAREICDLSGMTSKKKITAVIVGIGLHGTEMIKALSWYCQMEGYSLCIEAFDKDPLAKERFDAACPELIRNADEPLQINIYSGIDVTTREFVDIIKRLTETTYVLVSLGADVMNIRTAIKLRTYFAQAEVPKSEELCSAPVPIIQAIVYKAYKNDELRHLVNYKKESYSIEFIGDIDSLYTENVILDSALEAEGKEIHKSLFPVDEFDEYEYYYRSSCAAAIHIKAIASELKKRGINGNKLEKANLFLKLIFVFAVNPCKENPKEYFNGGSLPHQLNELNELTKKAGEIYSEITSTVKAFSWEAWNARTLMNETELESLSADLKKFKNILSKEGFSALNFKPEKYYGIEEIITQKYLNDNTVGWLCVSAEMNKENLYYVLLTEMLKAQEHRRWNVYMRTEGYISSKKRFDLGKMHHDIRPYSELPLSEKNKDIHLNKIIKYMDQ